MTSFCEGDLCFWFNETNVEINLNKIVHLIFDIVEFFFTVQNCQSPANGLTVAISFIPSHSRREISLYPISLDLLTKVQNLIIQIGKQLKTSI